MNIYSAVFGEAARRGQDDSAVAVIDLAVKATVTYPQLKATVDSLRASWGIKAGENIVLVMPNSLDLVVALLAIWAQGAAAAPLNPSYTEHEFKGLVASLGATTALIRLGDHRSRHVLAQAWPDLRIIEVDARSAAARISTGTRAEGQVPCPAGGEQLRDGTALYLHTSGTTGKPKAVPLRQSNLVCGANNVAEACGLGHADRTYLVMVLFHIHGIVAGMLAPLTTGGGIVVPGALDGSRAWGDFADNRCSWLTASPSILQALLAAPCRGPGPAIRFLRSCSSPLLPTVFRRLRERFGCPVLEAYAMTEASHQMCSNRPHDFAPGSVGPEVGSTRVCVAVGGRACAPGTPGEVCVAGSNVFGGYEGEGREANSDAFWEGPDERGRQARWFRTGDVGVLSADGRRRLTLIGRRSEMVNRGGEKISPVEVDEAVMGVPGVVEAASFAVPDDFLGHEIEAAVVVHEGSDLDGEGLRRALEKRLAPFKVPKRIHFCSDSIPKGPTGKIQRNYLSKLYGSGSGGSGLPHASSGPALSDGRVCSIVDKALGLPAGHAQRHPDSSLLDLGCDSLGLARIAAAFRQHLGKHLEVATLFSYPTVRTLTRIAAQAAASGPGGSPQQMGLRRPAAFSLLGVSDARLESMCAGAGVQREHVEDAYPLSASQKMHMDVLLGPHHDKTSLLWQLTRYRLAHNTDRQRLLAALEQWQRHEESLRWVMAKDDTLGWVTLQLRPGVEARVEEIRCGSEEEAREAVQARFAARRHVPGARTLALALVVMREQLELAFIESHCFTEGQGRLLMLQTLCQAYNGEPMDEYPSYSTFIAMFRPVDDPVDKLSFWASERAALERAEGAAWPLKQGSLVNWEHLAEEVLEVPDALGFVCGPLQGIASGANMTLPLFTEAIFSLSLALYLSQQSPSFTSPGSSVVYDRTASLRTADPRFSAVRAVTGAFHPHSMPLDLARYSLWTYLQHFNAMVRLRERNLCMGSTAELARHAVVFTWRFHDSEPESTGPLLAGIKGESIDFRGFSMCYVCVNRNGPDGLRIAVGCHPRWLAEQRRNGSRVELVDVFSRALGLVLGARGRLCDLALGDLEAASLGAARA